MSHDPAFDDASIPVLTEVVHDTPAQPAPAAADAAVVEVVLTEVIEQDHPPADERHPREGGDLISPAEAALHEQPAHSKNAPPPTSAPKSGKPSNCASPNASSINCRAASNSSSSSACATAWPTCCSTPFPA
jgi:hypothetical protein